MKRLPFALLLLLATTASAAQLTRTEQKIVAAVDARVAADLSLLERSVNIRSATENLTGVRAVGDLFAAELRDIGLKTKWIDMPPEMKRAGHLFAETGGTKGKRILLIGHLDTVLEGQPFVREGKLARGNGAEDMKGGDVIIIAALRALKEAGALDDRRIIVIFTGDEEDTGQPLEAARRDLIDAAKRSDLALAFEESVGDTATVARRGFTSWRLDVTATTAHSSGIFTEASGSGAVFEVARIINTFYEKLRGEENLTFNPSVVVGGTEITYDSAAKRGTAFGKTNVIAAKATAEGDLRFLTNEQRERTKSAMRAIVAASLPRASATISFTDEYPAMGPTPGNYALLKVLDQASHDLGYGAVPALEPAKRGAGDVSFVAPLLDSLDGLGSRGDGAHTAEERMDLESLPMLVKRTALLIYRLTR
jgi:glutamate carboxypeptidase